MNANIIHFDVEHGDSILIEIMEDNRIFYVVIDSNYSKRNSKYIVPVYEYLKNKNVNEISAVILTHLHADHYLGMEEIFKNFNVKKIIIPPFISHNAEIYKKQIHHLKNKISELVNRSSDPEIGQRAYSLAEIISYLSQNEEKIIEGEGTEMPLRLEGLSQPIGKIFLPMKKIKGTLRQIIATGNFELDTFKEMNASSVVFCLELQEHKVLFGADSTLDQWKDHEKAFARDGITNLGVNTLKAPHHGSKHNNHPDNYNYILKPGSKNNLIVSANGKSHPHDELFDLINKNDLQPYCTRLAKQCLGNVKTITSLNKIKKEFRSILANYDIEGDSQSCQGDISYSIVGSQITFYSSNANNCIYRPTNPAVYKSVI